MNRTISYGTVIIPVHLLVNIVHGLAHHELHIDLGGVPMLFVIGVIILCPLFAMVLLWTPQRRLGLILLALSMAGSFVFGLYNHFVAMGPDHVGRQGPGPWGTTFVLTAYLCCVVNPDCGESGQQHEITRIGSKLRVCKAHKAIPWLGHSQFADDVRRVDICDCYGGRVLENLPHSQVSSRQRKVTWPSVTISTTTAKGFQKPSGRCPEPSRFGDRVELGDELRRNSKGRGSEIFTKMI